jgi:predicted nucleic acid-binding protein
MAKCLIDSSIIVKHCMEGDRTLEDLLKGRDILYITPNVIEEAFYKCLLLRTEVQFKKAKVSVLKRRYEKDRDAYHPVIAYFNEFMRTLVESGFLKILTLNQEIILDSIVLSDELGLLPNDSLIAACANYYGVTKIATFDTDFKKVPKMKVIP